VRADAACIITDAPSRFPLRASRFPLRASLFALPSSRFPLRASLFALHSSRFTLRASLFALHSSRFTLRASLFALALAQSPLGLPELTFANRSWNALSLGAPAPPVAPAVLPGARPDAVADLVFVLDAVHPPPFKMNPAPAEICLFALAAPQPGQSVSAASLIDCSASQA